MRRNSIDLRWDGSDLHVVDPGVIGGALFVSDRLEHWVGEQREEHITVSKRGDNNWFACLDKIAVVQFGDETIVHYANGWEGSVTICRNGLVRMFGSVPRTLYVSRTKREDK